MRKNFLNTKLFKKQYNNKNLTRNIDNYMNNYSTLQSNYSNEEKNNYFLNNRTKSSNNNIYSSYYKFNTNFSNYINMNNRTKKNIIIPKIIIYLM